MKKKKLNLSGAFAFVLAFLILLVFVPINMIFSYYDKVYDMTPSKAYSLDPIMVQLLDDCADKDVEIYFLAELRDLQNVPKYLPLYHTLTELDSRDNITLTCFDPNEDTELMKTLNPDDRYDVTLADIYVKCGSNIRQLPFLFLFQTDSNGILQYTGEDLIAAAINACTTGNLPTIYFLTGLGSKTIKDNYADYAEFITSDDYQVKELDLAAVDSVPKDAAIVYLVAPERDLTVSEREKLNDFIDDGGSLQMLIPPCDTEGRFENIEFLLGRFGIGMDYNIIHENNPDWQLRNLDSTQDPEYFQVSYPAPGEDQTEDLTTDLNTKVSKGECGAGIAHARSFYELTGASEMLERNSLIQNLPTDQTFSAFTVESIPMGGDSETAKIAEERTGEPISLGYYAYNKQTGAKLVLIGSDDSLDNDRNLFSISGTRLLSTFTNTWLFDSKIEMGIADKSNSYDTMHFEDANEASTAIMLFFIAPVILAVIGLAVWLKRRYA